jgi:hypothetical protein
MNDVERLLAIEEIKSLKARYCRCVDTKNWDGWRQCFVPEIVIETFDFAEKFRSEGVDTLIANTSKLLAGAKTVHQVHNPEITFSSDTDAHAIWALHDILKWPEPNMFGLVSMIGYGNYDEKYRKTPAGWRITETIITRYYMEQEFA